MVSHDPPQTLTVEFMIIIYAKGSAYQPYRCPKCEGIWKVKRPHTRKLGRKRFWCPKCDLWLLP